MRRIYVDPAYSSFNQDRVFTATDADLNRDDQLSPFRQLRDAIVKRGHEIHTADLLPRGPLPPGTEYYSMGQVGDFDDLRRRGARLRAFMIFEPPVVAPHLYDLLPALTKEFETVYVHNTHGGGYSLAGVDRSRLRRLRWFQQYDDVLVPIWSRRDRLRKACVINSNRKPASMQGELYSERIRAIAELASSGSVDLYGKGWTKVLLPGGPFKRTLWWPVLRHYGSLRKTYRGSVASKFEVLGKYEFCLCLENMRMDGFMTEKLWDCLYSGTIPIYLGPKDVGSMVPESCFIDASGFKSWSEAWAYASSLPRSELDEMRQAGRAFIRGDASRPYKDSLLRMFLD